MPVSMIPFSRFKPDGGKYGFDLRKALNVLPIHGSFRPMRRGTIEASVAAGPCTGAFVHIYQQARQVQFLRPDSDVSNAGGWLMTTGSTLYSLLDEVDFDPSDYIYLNNPSAAVCIVTLSNPVGAVAGTGHYIRWRYNIPETPTSNWTVTVELLETTTVRATDSATGSTYTPGWIQREYALSAGEMAAIVNRDNLRLRFTATCPGAAQAAAPDSDVTVTRWATNAGGAVDLWDRINESAASDVDYIKSSVLPVGGAASTYRCTLVTGTVDPVTATGWAIRVRGRVLNDFANLDFVARLYSGGALVEELPATSINTTSYANYDLALTAAQVETIADLDDLEIELVASCVSILPGVPQQVKPIAESANTGWTPSTGSDCWAVVDEATASDADYFYSTVVNASILLELTTSGIVDPQALAASGYYIKIRATPSNTGQGFSATLYDGSTARAYFASSVTGAVTTYSYALTQAEINSISDWNNLSLEIVATGSTAGMQITWVQVQPPEPARIEISQMYLSVPTAVRAEVAWSEFEVPSATSTYRGDVPTPVIGTGTKLYEILNGVLTDISDAGGYSANGGCWDFCGFGNHIIATNYVNEVQFREDNTGLFKDMIVTPATAPKARFVAPVHGHLMLANINLTGHYPDEIWWSALQNVEDFEPSPTTQAGNARIVSAPGEIMGLVGGDYALVFKRRSIHRLDWTGGATVFHLRDVSTSNGTPYPNSIVEADSLVYWWGYDGFYRYNGDAIEKVGGDAVSRYLMDSRYSDGGIRQIGTSSLVDDDQIMVGWYDPFSGMLLWEYQGVTDDNHKHRRLIVYNPMEDRWSEGDANDLWESGRIAWACQQPNVTNSESYEMKGSILVGWDGTNTQIIRLSDPETAVANLVTKRFTIGLDQSEHPMASTLRGVMPLYSNEPGTTWPNVAMTVRSANDPRFVTELKSQTYTQQDANERQFLPHDNAGYFFDVDVTIPSMEAATVVSFDGIWVDSTPGGEG